MPKAKQIQKQTAKVKRALADKTESKPDGRLHDKVVRRGSFDRLLRFCNVLLFGPDTKVRLQTMFKAHAQRVVELGLITVLRNSMGRRYENKGMRITGPNVVGAYIDWANVFEGKLTDEFIQIRKVVDQYTPAMSQKDLDEKKHRLKVIRDRVKSKYAALLKQNIDKWKETGVKKITIWDENMDKESQRVFTRLFYAQRK
jgi:hypothetical protein